MRKSLRIFISSPGDVPEERLRAHLVVQKLARDYQRFFKIEPYLWEYEPMLASGHFQDAIEPPSRSDIVVLVVYSRLGTALPERTASREYHGIDGRAPVTGTEWEFEEALESKRLRGAPDLLAYRKVGDPQTSLADADRRAEQERQWLSLERFWARHFEGGGQFISGSKKFKSLEEFDKVLEADLVTVIEAKIAEGLRSDSGLGEVTWLHGSPFQGLAAYDFDDAPIFFGRDAQIRQASTRLQAAALAGTAFLLILGASGSGKSSLARAGLLPALFSAKAVPGIGVWRRVVLRPGENGMDPVRGLAEALLAGDVKQDEGLPEIASGGMSAADLAGHLETIADNPAYSFRQALAAVVAQARATRGLLPHEEGRLVILVDQVEELFTREFDPARRALFVRLLAGLARSGVVWLVATMRNDLWHRAAELPQLVELVEDGARLDLPAPGGAEIIEIVRRPAAAAGIVFENDTESGVGLDAVISRAASEEPGALPLLSVVLQSLYRRDVVEAGGRALTFAGYRALGELTGAIAERAGAALADLRGRDPEAAASLPRVLRALVTASEDGTATSRPARLDAFPPGGPEARLVAAFLLPENRLLVASERAGIAEVRLAHEALLENWPAAREQVATDRRDLQTRARLEVLQRRWQDAASTAEKKTALLASLNLAEGTDLVRRWGIPAGEGLGTYVAQSEAAERWRRRRVAVAASVLALVFAGIAALASLQWRRAENQTVVARAAEATEREARGAADAAKRDAERERDRADGERARALAALRDEKRGSARTLAVQSELRADRSEVHRALSLAAAAAETEREVLDPGEASVSYPALLRALSDDREVLHLDGPTNASHVLPHDFLGSAALVYADSKAGIMLAELPSGSVRQLLKLPGDVLPLNLRAASTLGLIVMTSVKNVFVVDAATGALKAQVGFDDRITALDLDEASRTAVIGTGTSISFIDLTNPARADLFAYPVRPSYMVGQVKFGGSRKVFATSGAEIREFDRDAGRFGEPLTLDLTSDNLGLTREFVDRNTREGYTAPVEIAPDVARNRIFLRSPLQLQAVKADASRFDYPRETFDTMLGVSFTEPDRTGDVVSIIGHRVETGIDMRIAYISDEKPLAYDAFRLSASDLGNEQLDGCKVTRDVQFVACTYGGKNGQGLVVWHVAGGKHRGARLVRAKGNYMSAVSLAGTAPRLLVGSRSGLAWLPSGAPVTGLTWGEEWRLGEQIGAYVTAVAPGKVQVFRLGGGDALAPALTPTDGAAVVVRGRTDMALVAAQDRLAVHDLRTGRSLWSVPGLSGLRYVALDPAATRVVAATVDQVLVFDAKTGRFSASHPIAGSPDSTFAIDDAARFVAFVGPGEAGPQLLDLETGAVRPLLPGQKGKVVQIAFGLEADRIVLGMDDGDLVAVSPKGEQAWAIPSPAKETFAATALEGQKPRGTILQLAVSPAKRLAVVRQDMLPVDLYDLASGQFQTQLTPPWTSGVPGSVAFDPDDRIVTAWALHPVTRTTSHEVSLHALPLTREDALKTVQATLTRSLPRRPDGTLASPGTPGN